MKMCVTRYCQLADPKHADHNPKYRNVLLRAAQVALEPSPPQSTIIQVATCMGQADRQMALQHALEGRRKELQKMQVGGSRAGGCCGGKR